MATEASPPCRAGLPRFGGASPPKPRPLTCGLRAAACCTRSVTARSAGPSPSPAAMPALHIPGRLPPPSATPPLPAPRAQPITAQRRGSWPMAAGGGRPGAAAMLGRSGRHGGWCKGHPKGGEKHPGAPQKHPRTPQRHSKARGQLGGAEGKGWVQWPCSGCLQCAPIPSLPFPQALPGWLPKFASAAPGPRSLPGCDGRRGAVSIHPAPQHPPPAEELHRVSTSCSFIEREGVEQALLPGSGHGPCSNPRPSGGEIKSGGQQLWLLGGQVAPDDAELTASCMACTVRTKTPRNHPKIHPRRNGILAIHTEKFLQGATSNPKQTNKP